MVRNIVENLGQKANKQDQKNKDVFLLRGQFLKTGQELCFSFVNHNRLKAKKGGEGEGHSKAGLVTENIYV